MSLQVYSVVIGFVITMFPLLLLSHEVDWKLGSKFLQFGKNAKLVCNGTECMGDVPRGWMGGNPYRLLCTDQKSRNPDKYEWKPERDGTAFELMIKNFSITDLNCNYTCNCGFKLWTKPLTFSDSIFYPLDANLISNSSKKEKDAFIIDVDIRRVYPFPECKQYLVYANKTIRKNLTISKETDSDGIFKLHINSRVFCEDHNSLIDTTIMCSLKNEVVNVLSERIDCRFVNEKRCLPTATSVMIGVSLAVIIALIVVFVKYKRKKKSSEEMEPEQKVRMKSEHFDSYIDSTSTETIHDDNDVFLYGPANYKCE